MCVRNEVEIQRVGVLEIVKSLCQICLCSAVGLMTDTGRTCYLLDMFVIVWLLTA